MTGPRDRSGVVAPQWQPWMGDAACCLALIAGCLAVGLPRYLFGIDLADEGFLAYGAVRVLEGQIPNRDFWSLQPPLSFYSLAGVFAMFGTSLVSLRAFGLVIYTAIPLLVYAISRQRLGRLASLGAAAPAVMMGMPLFNFVPFAVWQGICASLVGAWCILRAFITGRRRWALAAGIATAMAMLARHDQGIYLTLSIVTYALVLRSVRTGAAKARLPHLVRTWAAGAAAPLILLAIPWLISGALPSMFQQLVIFPLTRYGKTSSLPMPVFKPDLSMRAWLMAAMFRLPPIVDALVGLWLVLRIGRRFRAEHAHVAFLGVLSALFYCQALTRSDLQHLIITLPPFFVVLAWALAAISKAAAMPVERRFGADSFVSRCARPAIGVLAIPAGIWVLMTMAPDLTTAMTPPLATLNLARGGVILEAPLARSLAAETRLIQEHSPPNGSILALPYCPMYYFLAERRNPTRWNYLWHGDQTDADHLALITQAMKDPPAVVVIVKEDRMQGYAKIIVDYVKARYRLVQDSDELKLYLPEAQAPLGAQK